jgi:HlyD family secretion protein
VLADQNDAIKAGAVLATLDDGELRQQVAVAAADVEVARASLERVEWEIDAARSANLLARTEHERIAQMLASGAASGGERDKAVQQRDAAAAEFRRASAAKVELERQLVRAEETLRYYRERLADTSMLAPFDGLVVRRAKEPGDVVVPGTAILEVISTAEIWVSAWVDESAVAGLCAGRPARVVFRSEPARTYRGKVARVSPQTDRETREFLVDVSLEALPPRWAIGQRAEVHVEVARRDDALVVPQRMVTWRGGKPGVMIADGGKARWRNVTLGLRGTAHVEVAEGLSEGQVVIESRDASKALRDGRRVKVGGP